MCSLYTSYQKFAYILFIKFNLKKVTFKYFTSELSFLNLKNLFNFRLYPSSSELYTALGLLHMKLGEYELAFDKLGSALAHDPMCVKALLAAGSVIQVIILKLFNLFLTVYINLMLVMSIFVNLNYKNEIII